MGGDAERARRHRDKARGGPPRKRKSCPSYPAFRRHQRDEKAGKPWTCDDPEGCRQAYTDYQRGLQRARRARDGDTGS